MQINTDGFEYLAGDGRILNNMSGVPVRPVFSDQAVSFLSALSKELLADRRAREYPDVMSYAYWIRRASLEKEKMQQSDRSSRIGRGTAFHIAPSNVPVNFAVSMASSVLAGNATMIRLSDKRSKQADMICGAMNRLLGQAEHAGMKPYFSLFRYAHDEAVTRSLSAVCDVRVVWGGDRTVETIRRAPLPPRAVELTFADRHSIALIHADEYLRLDAAETARGFYTDTYYTDQNACSSPRLVVWLGEHKKEARKRFWAALHEIVRKEYPLKPIQAVDKYAKFCRIGMKTEGVRLIADDNYTIRVETDHLTGALMDDKSGSGYFFEYEAESLSDILPVLNKQCQTVSVLGIAQGDVRDLVFTHGVRGVDRIVPLGRTMELGFVWDGYRMIEAMSRVVYL